MNRVSLLSLVFSLLITTADAAPKTALFSEDFNGLKDGGNGSQTQTGLPLKHSANLRGWTNAGLHSVHALRRANGNWALQLVGAAGNDNILTLDTGFAANVKGKTYTVSFDAGPSVWAGGQQATRADHRFSIELLRKENTVLAKHNVSPGAWAGEQTFSHRTFTYQGDGSGDLRFRLSPVDSKGTYLPRSDRQPSGIRLGGRGRQSRRAASRRKKNGNARRRP